MTLDEAIKHAEEVADVCESEASKYDMTDAYESYVACQEGKCAEEHRQLAEWLKELKQLTCEDIEIPNGATNGDMIKAMFPYIEIEGIGGEIKCIATKIGFGTSYFALDWWNAPYKKCETYCDDMEEFEEVLDRRTNG